MVCGLSVFPLGLLLLASVAAHTLDVTPLHADSEPNAEHHCIHDQLVKEPSTTTHVKYAGHPFEETSQTRRRMADNIQGLRILFDYDNLVVNGDSPSALDVAFLKEDLLPQAKAWLEGALRVVPVSGNLLIDRFCTSWAEADPISCFSYSSPTCGEVTHPTKYLNEKRECEWGTHNCEVTIPAGSGAPNTDIIIYVKAVSTGNCGGSTIAYASGCAQDQHGRPVAGYINFCPNMIQRESSAFDKQMVIAIHEIMHVLGFAKDKFGDFKDSSGNARATVTESINERAHTVTKMTTPAVKSKAREHFGCDTLNGAEIENQGGSGTAGSHWEKRIFGFEGMTGSVSNYGVFGSVTLALFEDSGWYYPDYSKALDSYPGKLRGCSFAVDDCIPTGTNSNENKVFHNRWCAGDDYVQCAPDRSGWGVCNLGMVTGGTLPSYYSYFSDDTSIVGTDQTADFCPYMETFSFNGKVTQCKDSSTQDDTFAPYLGETYGSSSTCFHAKLKPSWMTQLSNYEGRCLAYECDTTSGSTVLKISVGDTKYTCPTAGGEVSVSSQNYKDTSVQGSIWCPPVDEPGLCDGCASPCQNGGACMYNKCQCPPGYTGSDCSTVQCPSNCNGNGKCTERTDGTFACVCDEGFEGSSCSGGEAEPIVCGANDGWPETNAGVTASKACDSPYSGTQTRHCDTGGAWGGIVTTSCTIPNCPVEGDWPETAPSQSAVISCTTSGGLGGTQVRQCSSTGTWESPSECSKTTSCDASDGFSAAAEGETVTKTCGEDQFGSVTAKCVGGDFTNVDNGCYDPCPFQTCNSCAGKFDTVGDDSYMCSWCSTTNSCYNFLGSGTCADTSVLQTSSCPRTQCDPEGDYPATEVGDTATIACPDGMVGTLSRKCKSTGYWDTAPEPDTQGYLCEDSSKDNCPPDQGWAETKPADTAHMDCPEGQVGSISRTCGSGGTWGNEDASECATPQADPCPQDGKWPITQPATTATLTCPPHGEATKTAGSPSRTCSASGVWEDVTDDCYDPCMEKSSCADCASLSQCRWCESPKQCRNNSEGTCTQAGGFVTDWEHCPVPESVFECPSEAKTHFEDAAKKLTSCVVADGSGGEQCSVDCKSAIEHAYTDADAFLQCLYQRPCYNGISEALDAADRCITRESVPSCSGTTYTTYVRTAITAVDACGDVTSPCNSTSTCKALLEELLIDEESHKCMQAFPCVVPELMEKLDTLRYGCNETQVETCSEEKAVVDNSLLRLSNITDVCSSDGIDVIYEEYITLRQKRKCSLDSALDDVVNAKLWGKIEEVNGRCPFVSLCTAVPATCANLGSGSCGGDCRSALKGVDRSYCDKMMVILREYDSGVYDMDEAELISVSLATAESRCPCQGNFTLHGLVTDGGACGELFDHLDTSTHSEEHHIVTCSAACAASLRLVPTCSMDLLNGMNGKKWEAKTQAWSELFNKCGFKPAATGDTTGGNGGDVVGATRGITLGVSLVLLVWLGLWQ